MPFAKFLKSIDPALARTIIKSFFMPSVYGLKTFGFARKFRSASFYNND